MMLINLNTRIQADLEDQFRELCKQKNISNTKIIRELVVGWVQQNGNNDGLKWGDTLIQLQGSVDNIVALAQKNDVIDTGVAKKIVYEDNLDVEEIEKEMMAHMQPLIDNENHTLNDQRKISEWKAAKQRLFRQKGMIDPFIVVVDKKKQADEEAKQTYELKEALEQQRNLANERNKKEEIIYTMEDVDDEPIVKKRDHTKSAW